MACSGDNPPQKSDLETQKSVRFLDDSTASAAPSSSSAKLSDGTSRAARLADIRSTPAPGELTCCKAVHPGADMQGFYLVSQLLAGLMPSASLGCKLHSQPVHWGPLVHKGPYTLLDSDCKAHNFHVFRAES